MWWFGIVWTGWSSILSKHPFCHVTVILFIFYFKSSWWKNSLCIKELNQFRPPSSSDDLCLLFWLILFLWLEGGVNLVVAVCWGSRLSQWAWWSADRPGWSSSARTSRGNTDTHPKTRTLPRNFFITFFYNLFNLNAMHYHSILFLNVFLYCMFRLISEPLKAIEPGPSLVLASW